MILFHSSKQRKYFSHERNCQQNRSTTICSLSFIFTQVDLLLSNQASVQIDAAINPGNSGGPVIYPSTKLLAGVAFQNLPQFENMGYIMYVIVCPSFHSF